MCSYCKKKGHKASECFKKKKKDKEEKEKASKTSTSGVAMKANVAIVEDDHITLLDLSSPPVPECIGHSWMAIAEDDLIQLLDPPMPNSIDRESSPDVLPISNLNSISPTDITYMLTQRRHAWC